MVGGGKEACTCLPGESEFSLKCLLSLSGRRNQTLPSLRQKSKSVCVASASSCLWRSSSLYTADGLIFTKCNNACSPEWKTQQPDCQSPGPPSWEGMISLGDPWSLGHACLLCAAQVSFFVNMCEKYSRTMSGGFPLTSANTGAMSSDLGQIHKFTFFFIFSHSFWYMFKYSPVISEFLK